MITASGNVEDEYWLNQAFFMQNNKVSERQENAMRATNANRAFHDTTLGGNSSINPKYQFTRTCDPKAPTLAASSKGQGYYYNKAIDENAQRIWLQFGVMEFNSVGSFIRHSYNYKQAYLANKGKVASGMFFIGQVLGYLASSPLQVFFGINSVWERTLAFLNDRPYSRFAYLKPTMSVYWSTATMLFNKLASQLGRIPGLTAEDIENISSDGTDKTAKIRSVRNKVGNVDAIVASMPDTWVIESDRLYIDLMAVSAKGQRLAHQYHRSVNDIRDSSSSSRDYAARVNNYVNSRFILNSPKKAKNMDNYLSEYLKAHGQASDDFEERSKKDIVVDIKEELEVNNLIEIQDKEPGFSDFFTSELSDGSAFVSFVVDNQGPITDSFSNSTKNPGIQDIINGVTEKARDLHVNFSGGNIGSGFFADTLETVIGGVSSLIAGGLDSVGLGGLAALGGSGFTEFSQVYDNSEASFDGGSFTMTLSTPYGGSKEAIMQDILAPLCMILAGALPKATGKSSYTSPFCCRLYSPGRCDWRLAMIKNLTITRGTSNVGWSAIASLPTAIEVKFDVETLDDIVSLPVSTNLLKDALSFDFFDEPTPMSDYLGSIAGLSLYDRYYLSGKIALGWAETKVKFSQITSPATLSQRLAYTTGGELLKMVWPGNSLVTAQ